MCKRVRSWKSLFRDEYAAREALDRVLADNRRPSAEQFRKWWKSVENLLLAYAIAVGRGSVPEPPPADLAERLSNLAGYLAVGRIPHAIERARSKGGNPRAGPDERRAKELAVAYHKACLLGIMHNGKLVRIDDACPLETLAEWFDVSKNAIRMWLKHHCPAFLGINDVDANVITKLTQRAADDYKHWGRGQNALQRRQGKRQRR